MLKIRGLEKTYTGGVKALDGLDLDIGSGMFGLLGPNGAGKSSFMRTLACLQLPDAGSITFDGIDVLARPYDLRCRLGYLPQSFGAYPFVGCRALLRHMAAMKGLPEDISTERQVDRLIELTNLEPHASRPVSNFSGGMRQRFGIAQALLGDPSLLILDEPTAGLDPEERLRLYNLLSQLSKDRVVILSSHIVDDIEQLCPELAIIREGRIAARGETENLVAKFEGRIWQGSEELATSGDMTLLSTAYFRGSPVYRYHGQRSPGFDYEAMPPTLQDLYFHQLRARQDEQ